MAGAGIYQKDVIRFPTPDYARRDNFYIQNHLRRTEFFLASCEWGIADRHALRVALEKTPDTNEAAELAFKSFAIERGLLSPRFFEQPGYQVPYPYHAEMLADVAGTNAARNPPLWRRALQHLRFH
jgi:hypothetical protein